MKIVKPHTDLTNLVKWMRNLEVVNKWDLETVATTNNLSYGIDLGDRPINVYLAR